MCGDDGMAAVGRASTDGRVVAARGGAAVAVDSTVALASADGVEGGVGTELGASAPAAAGSLAVSAIAAVLGGVI